MTESSPSRESPSSGARSLVLVPGLFAWLITVAEPARQAGGGLVPRVAAGVALAMLVLVFFSLGGRAASSRVFALYAFVVSCAVSWTLLRPELAPDRLDHARAAAGALAWLLFAFGWGRAGRSPSFDTAPRLARGAPLAPRAHTPRAGVLVAVVAVGVALALGALSFRVERTEHALFSHAAATACALLLLAVAGRIALAQGLRHELRSPKARLDAASVPGALLAVLFGLGLVWAAFR